MAKQIFKVIGMHCPSCAASIQLDLEDAGIKASCSYAKETLEVESGKEEQKSKLVFDKIRKVIKPLGYDLE